MVDVLDTNQEVSYDLARILRGMPASLAPSIGKLYNDGFSDSAIWLSEIVKKAQVCNSMDLPKRRECLASLEPEAIAASVNHNIFVNGDLSSPYYLTMKDGNLTLITGEEAYAWLDAVSLTIDESVNPPILLLASADYVPYNSFRDIVPKTVVFAASFSTDAGESALSNSIILETTSWNSVTLAIEESSIPYIARTVRYYRLFYGVFRLVSEVTI